MMLWTLDRAVPRSIATLLVLSQWFRSVVLRIIPWMRWVVTVRERPPFGLSEAIPNFLSAANTFLTGDGEVPDGG